jgi:hypothetical protein
MELNLQLIVRNFKEFKIDLKNFKLEIVNILNDLLIYLNLNIKDEQVQQYIMYISDIFINIIYILNTYIIYLIELDYMSFMEIMKNIYILCCNFISRILNYIKFNEIYIFLKWYIFILLKSYNGI